MRKLTKTIFQVYYSLVQFGLSGLSFFLMATEEDHVKVSDRREGLVADKRGVNSSVNLSLQGARMIDHQSLKVTGDWLEWIWAVEYRPYLLPVKIFCGYL